MSTGVWLSTGSWGFRSGPPGAVRSVCHSSSMTDTHRTSGQVHNHRHRRNLRTVGARGEDTAAAWFIDRGYDLLDRNFFTRRGEVDIVLRTPPDHPDHPAVVFVEVKWRLNDRYGAGAEAITPAKLAAVRHAARDWLAQHPGLNPGSLRIDVLDITAGEITHYEGVDGW